VLTRERALEVMRDDATFTVQDERFTTGRVVGPSMLTLDGAEHARHREPFARPFRRAAVLERFTPLVEAESERLAAGLRPGADARRGFAGPLAATIVTHALGLQAVGVERVLGWYEAIVAAVTELTAGRALPPAGAEGFAALRAAMLRSADAKSLFADAARGIGDEEAVSNAAVLLFGGIETTEGMIANALWHLLTNPGELALVRADPGLDRRGQPRSRRLRRPGPLRRPPRQREAAPRVRPRPARLHRDAPGAAGGAHRAARAPGSPRPAAATGRAHRAARARVPQAAAATRRLLES
jgi:cytochrome P450